MRIKNTGQRYGLVAILLHWIIAILMIALLAEGWYMVSLPVSLSKLKLFGWHKEYGFLVLALVIVRLSWRIINKVPELNLPWWERFGARLVHWAFYGFMFALPVTGWLITSAAGLPVSFFGLFTIPVLVAPGEEPRLLFEWIHKWLGYGLALSVFLHVSAALKHHFINRDDILRRIIS